MEPSIEGVRVVSLSSVADDRGSFVETFRQAWLPDDAPSMVQSNLSTSRAGVLRGLHFHRRQADYWCVIEGSAFVALYDLRTSRPPRASLGPRRSTRASNSAACTCPPGVAHGFCAVTDVRLLYMVDAYFTGEDEHGFAWNDPAAAISVADHRPGAIGTGCGGAPARARCGPQARVLRVDAGAAYHRTHSVIGSVGAPTYLAEPPASVQRPPTRSRSSNPTARRSSPGRSPGSRVACGNNDIRYSCPSLGVACSIV